MTVFTVCVDSRGFLQSCLCEWASRCFDYYLLQSNSLLIAYCHSFQSDKLFSPTKHSLLRKKRNGDTAQLFFPHCINGSKSLAAPFFQFYWGKIKSREGSDCSELQRFGTRSEDGPLSPPSQPAPGKQQLLHFSMKSHRGPEELQQ